MTRGGKIAIILLFILVLISLGLNLFLYWQLSRLQQQGAAVVQNLHAALPQAISELEAFEKATIEYDLPIKQEFPVQAEIPFHETLDIPIQTTVPISQTINTSVMIDPLGTGVQIPVEINTPVNIAVPIDTTVSFTIDHAIPISTTILLDLSVPLAVRVSETDLAKYVEQLRSGLISLDEMLTQLEP